MRRHIFGDGRFTGVPESGGGSAAVGPGPVYWGREFFDVVAHPKLLGVLRDFERRVRARGEFMVAAEARHYSRAMRDAEEEPA